MSPIANMLAQLKNAQSRGLEEVVLPFSKIKLSIAEILKTKGFVSEIEKKKKKMKKAEVDVLQIRLKYKNGVGAIEDLRLVSKPSRRVYAGKDELRQVKNGYGFSVISTSKGLMTEEDARKAGVGGEVIF
ncbi:MAG: 30S ribosomal protein S8, partial [Candidatus Paceibacterota bacterium]